MWWLLLVWIEGEVYIAHSVHATVEQCAALSSVGDRCAQVELRWIDAPQAPEVEVTVLPSVGEMGVVE